MATALAPSNFQPHFKRVAAGEDRHADVYCVIASLVGNGKTLDDIRKQAETLGVPKTGPYYPYIDGDLIAKLLATYGLVADWPLALRKALQSHHAPETFYRDTIRRALLARFRQTPLLQQRLLALCYPVHVKDVPDGLIQEVAAALRKDSLAGLVR